MDHTDLEGIAIFCEECSEVLTIGANDYLCDQCGYVFCRECFGACLGADANSCKRCSE